MFFKKDKQPEKTEEVKSPTKEGPPPEKGKVEGKEKVKGAATKKEEKKEEVEVCHKFMFFKFIYERLR